MTAPEPLVEVVDLAKHYPIPAGKWGSREAGVVQAVAGVSFEVRRGETLALVGKSGCGKSTIARLLMRLIDPTSGAIRFDGIDLATLDAEALRRERVNFQMVFQDAGSSFNPRMRVGQIVAEPLKLMGVPKAERRRRVAELLQLVGIGEYGMARFPHEFSGGQRQRIGIARALVLNPRFLVCDEPVSALDVSIQAQVINLLSDLQKEFELTYLFVSHDLRVVRHVANRVAVMYLGKIVEIGPAAPLYAKPRHPYTRALLAAVPRRHASGKPQAPPVEGEIPSARNPPSGCRFHTRCPIAQPLCAQVDPELLAVDDDHRAACHFA